jgi:hypothetical protein
VSDQTACPFSEGQLIGETTLQQHADTEMARHVSHFDQSDVFANTKVNELLSFGEDEQMSHHWRLNLCELLAEVLNNDVVQTSSELDRFLPNQFEALIKLRLNFVCYEDSGFQSLFYIWTRGNFAELFENLGGALFALPEIASAN